MQFTGGGLITCTNGGRNSMRLVSVAKLPSACMLPHTSNDMSISRCRSLRGFRTINAYIMPTKYCSSSRWSTPTCREARRPWLKTLN